MNKDIFSSKDIKENEDEDTYYPEGAKVHTLRQVESLKGLYCLRYTFSEPSSNFFTSLSAKERRKPIIKLFHSCLYALFSLRPAPDTPVVVLSFEIFQFAVSFLNDMQLGDVIIIAHHSLPYFLSSS